MPENVQCKYIWLISGHSGQNKAKMAARSCLMVSPNTKYAELRLHSAVNQLLFVTVNTQTPSIYINSTVKRTGLKPQPNF